MYINIVDFSSAYCATNQVLAQIPHFWYSPRSHISSTRLDPTFSGTHPDVTFSVLARIPHFWYSPRFHLFGTRWDSTFFFFFFFRYSPGSNIFRCLPGPFSGVCPGILIFSSIASGCHHLFRHYVEITHLPRHRDLFSLSPSIGVTLFCYPSLLGKGTKLLVIWVLH